MHLPLVVPVGVGLLRGGLQPLPDSGNGVGGQYHQEGVYRHSVAQHDDEKEVHQCVRAEQRDEQRGLLELPPGQEQAEEGQRNVEPRGGHRRVFLPGVGHHRVEPPEMLEAQPAEGQLFIRVLAYPGYGLFLADLVPLRQRQRHKVAPVLGDGRLGLLYALRGGELAHVLGPERGVARRAVEMAPGRVDRHDIATLEVEIVPEAPGQDSAQRAQPHQEADPEAFGVPPEPRAGQHEERQRRGFGEPGQPVQHARGDDVLPARLLAGLDREENGGDYHEHEEGFAERVSGIGDGIGVKAQHGRRQFAGAVGEQALARLVDQHAGERAEQGLGGPDGQHGFAEDDEQEAEEIRIARRAPAVADPEPAGDIPAGIDPAEGVLGQLVLGQRERVGEPEYQREEENCGREPFFSGEEGAEPGRRAARGAGRNGRKRRAAAL